jgi:actin related protein 2/3 complex subunit 2
MILLETINRIILEALQNRLDPNSDKREIIDVVMADFGGVRMHLAAVSDATPNILRLSIGWKCLPQLLNNGAREDINRIYGAMVQSSPEQGYDFSIQFNADALPNEKFIETIANFKRNFIAAPFYKVFDAVNKGQSHPLIALPYRDEEALYIKGEPERVTVVYSITFRDAADQVLAKIFLKEFEDGRKNMSNAPSVSYSSKDAPMEIRGAPGVKEGEGHGFVTMVLFANHIKNADKTINTIQTFRDYLHYHIKCGKAYLHNRMRNKVTDFLQVLNRAKPSDSAPKEKKTFSGKTLIRK